ncbi:NADH-quinone oxidoreductase subunit M [bacterium]|nr:NADH-quinone oxidoreductase subunit M [bacterium]
MPPLTNLNSFWLIAMTFIPAIAAVLLIAFPRPLARVVALVATMITLLISVKFVAGIVIAPAEWTASVSADWIPIVGIKFLLGLDGLSGSLIVLTNVLMVLSVLGSWTAIDSRQREFYFWLLLLQTGIIGTFLALDLIVFYIFWELMLVPLYFLIGVFGSVNRIYATMKFFLFTFAGSVLMLLGILALYFQHRALAGSGSFALADLLTISDKIDPRLAVMIFTGFMLAFLIKVPIFPLHTWLPDAHTEAPTAGSVILAGVLLKTGVYGILRFAIPLFPNLSVQVAPLMIALAVVGIIYGALTAFAQSDLKRLVAYSSVSHMGFIMLGIFAFQKEAIVGATLQMINHGISTGGLFLCVGYLYERRHTRELKEFGGLAYNMRVYATLTVILVLSSVGLPGLNGFIGEFWILVGTFMTHKIAAVIAATGVILAAVYLLRMVQMTFFGPLDKEENKKVSDLDMREILTLVVLIIFAFWIGLYPRPYAQALEPSAQHIVEVVGKTPLAPIAQK